MEAAGLEEEEEEEAMPWWCCRSRRRRRLSNPRESTSSAAESMIRRTYRWWQLEPTGGVSSTAISRDDLGRGLAQQHEHRSMHTNSQSTTNATLPNDITDWEGEGEMRKRLTCGPILVLDPDQVHEGSMWHMPTLSHGADQGLVFDQ
uniref:Uncharacterized protein n=1 Tax=Oryza nivara TaxID=4536 RepID=A0A0E0HC57_ORYNI